MTRHADFDDLAASPRRSAPGRFWFGAVAAVLCAGAAVYAGVAGPDDAGLRALVMSLAAALGGLGVYAAATAGREGAVADRGALAAVSESIDAYLTTDALGLVLDTNRAARSLLSRLSPELGLRRPVVALFAADAYAEGKVYRLMRAALNAGGAEERFAAPSGGTLHVVVTRTGREDTPALWRITLLAPEPAPVRPPEPAAPEEGPDPLAAVSFGYYRADRGGAILEMNAALSAMIGLAGTEPPASLTIDTLFAEGGATLSPALGRVGEELVVAAALRGPGAGRVSVEVTQTLLETPDAGAIAHGFVFPMRAGGRASRDPAGSRLTRIFNNAPVATAVLDLDGTIAEVNDLMVDMSGGAARSGAPITVCVKMEERPALEKLLATVATGRRVEKPSKFVFTNAEGKERTAQVFISRAALEHGPALVLFLVDVTDQIVLERRMAQTQKMQAIGQLTGNIAHDFNNILTVINGNCELLLNKQEAGDPAFADLKQIQGHAKRAAQLVKKLLAFSRRQTLEQTVVQVTDRLLDASQFVGRILGEKIKLRFQHGRDLWPVRIDPAEFDRVIMNLCVNARDAMPEGGDIIIRTRNVPQGEVRGFGHEIMPAADYVLIEVIDSGVGIPKENIAEIFQPFFTTKPASEGTGLGLASVYGIVKQMDGWIFADSQPGKGATFRIFLPRVREVARAAPARVEAPAGPRDLSGKGAILLVEDETPVRMLARRALEIRGYHVIDAGSGEAALKIIKNADQPIDLVISDVVMPNMDGPSLLRHIRETRPDVKVIFMSGYAEEAFRKSLRGDEDFVFIPKPFSLKDLALKVKQTLAAPGA